MSFLDDAREVRKEAEGRQQRVRAERESESHQIIDRHFPDLDEELYLELRREAVSAYKTLGTLADLDYHKKWPISMDFRQYDSTVVENHIRQCMESAFMRFVHEVGAGDRLVEYHKPGKYGGQFIPGYRIITFYVSGHGRNDSDSPHPDRFEVTLYSRFTPSLT